MPLDTEIHTPDETLNGFLQFFFSSVPTFSFQGYNSSVRDLSKDALACSRECPAPHLTARIHAGPNLKSTRESFLPGMLRPFTEGQTRERPSILAVTNRLCEESLTTLKLISVASPRLNWVAIYYWIPKKRKPTSYMVPLLLTTRR